MRCRQAEAFAWPGLDTEHLTAQIIIKSFVHTLTGSVHTNKQSSEFTSTVNSLYNSSSHCTAAVCHSLRTSTDHTVVRVGQHHQQINTHATSHTGPATDTKSELA